MFLIVGLGNPGKKYQNTWHNIGFEVIDFFQKENNFPEFKFNKNFNSLISKKKEIILVKPETFMNLSGKALSKIAWFYKINSQNIVVVHDDIDLILGKIKINKNRGPAGHKGIESIIKQLKTKNLIRFRFGIQPIKNKPKNTEKFVLEKFNKKDKEIIEKTIKKTTQALDFFLKNNLEKTMNKFNE
jgi:peptidyl-tRNA hydrolase, PTH1 family